METSAAFLEIQSAVATQKTFHRFATPSTCNMKPVSLGHRAKMFFAVSRCALELVEYHISISYAISLP